MQTELCLKQDIPDLKTEEFVRAALEYMRPYKGTYIYSVFARDFLEKTDRVDAGYGRWLSQLLAYLIERYELKDDPRILDFGCGTGELAVRMASLGFNTTGIDSHEDSLRLAGLLARENGLPNIRFILNRDKRLPFADGAFDIVTMFSVVEHLSDETLKWLLPELSRTTSTSGVVYVLVPNKLKTRDDHTGLPFIPWLPGWLAAPYVKLCGRSHPSSMLESGKWGVYYRSFNRVKELFAKNGFDCDIPKDGVIYPSLKNAAPLFRIGKRVKFFGREIFLGLPLPWKALMKLGCPRQAFYPYFNLAFVPSQKNQGRIPLGDKGIMGERTDIKFDKDIRTRSEHIWRYRLALRGRAKGRFLDIGSGTGYGAGFLKGAGCDVYGIDVSGKALNYARRNYPGPRYIRSSGDNLPFVDNSFDAVTAFEVIEHIPEAKKALSEIKRVLKKGGDLFISTPNPRHLTSVIKHILFRRPYPEKIGSDNIYHIREFYYEEFLAMLDEYGFRVKSKYGQTLPRVPTFYKINFDLGRHLPKYAWTIVVHAVKEGRGKRGSL